MIFRIDCPLINMLCPNATAPSSDLRHASSWSFSNGVGNPASLYSTEMRHMFDAAFRADATVGGFGGSGAGRGAGTDLALRFRALPAACTAQPRVRRPTLSSCVRASPMRCCA